MNKCELKFDAQVNGYNIKNVMLDLGSNVNILLKKYWEDMGCPSLIYSHVQLRINNQYHIFHIS